jgi:hypothetical protein
MLNTGLKGRFWPIFFFKQRRRGTKDSCDSPTRCADVLALTAAKEALDRGIRRMRQHHDRSHDPGKVRRFRRKPRHHVSNYDGRRGRVLACSSSAARFRTSVPRFASRRLGETRISRPGQDGYPIGASTEVMRITGSPVFENKSGLNTVLNRAFWTLRPC